MPSLAANIGRLNSRRMSKLLRDMAQSVVDVLPNGEQVTFEERLRDLLWHQAVGYEEEIIDDNGNKSRIKHPPVGWCQQYVIEQMDGKTPLGASEEHTGMKAADKVRELAKDRLNQLATVAAGDPTPVPVKTNMPPKFKPKGDTNGPKT